MKKRNRDRFYFFWSLAIIICLICVLFALVFVSCLAQRDPGESEPGLSESQSPNATAQTDGRPTFSSQSPDETIAPSVEPPVEPSAPPPTILEETEDMGDEYFNNIIFLGDSTTYGMLYYGCAAESQVWTPANKTLTLGRHNIDMIIYPDTGEEMPLKDAAALKKPELMVITLGVNGVSFLKEDGFKAEYRDLVDTLKEASPDTKIIINTIYPVSTSYINWNSINTEKIDAANTWLLSVAEESGVRFMDTNSILADENGNLPETAHNGDGLHLNADSFSKVVEYIRTHGYK